MVRNANWMADRLRFSPPRRFLPVRCTRLLQLPDELLLHVLRALMRQDGTQKAHNVRDLWNMATTCKRLYALATEMMCALRPWRMVLDDDVPHGVKTAIPDDVVQGVLLAVRVGGAGLRALRLGGTHWPQLQAALKQLARHSSLTELSFLDTPGGADVPQELGGCLTSVSIISPHERTLISLGVANCRPDRFQLFRADDITLGALIRMWQNLLCECSSVDITWTDDSIAAYETLRRWDPTNATRRERMRVWSRSDSMPFDERYALSMCAPSMRTSEGQRHGDAMFGAHTIWVTEWLRTKATNARWMPQEPQRAREKGGALTVVIESVSAAKALLSADGVLLHLLVDEVVRGKGGDGCIHTLLVTAAPIHVSRDVRAVAQVVARIAEAVDEVRVLATTAVVFAELKDVLLPSKVRSVGVVDSSVTTAFVRALPAALATLSKTAGAERSVWVQSMRLHDLGDARRREALLRRAEKACRRAEAAGLCAVSVRGTIERWLRAVAPRDVT